MGEFIFALSFGLTLLTIIIASLSDSKWVYWLAGICVYIFSFAGMWDFRGYTLSLAFGLLALAIGHSLRLVTKLYHSVIAVAAGFLLWFAIFEIVGDSWLFLPYSIFSWLSL